MIETKKDKQTFQDLLNEIHRIKLSLEVKYGRDVRKYWNG